MGLVLVVALLASVALYLRMEKSVTLVVDGKARSVRTFSSSVSDLLEGEGLEIGRYDVVSPSLGAGLADGMRIRVLLAKEITLVLNGRPRTIHVTGSTVEEVLEQVNLRSGNRAYVRPSRKARVEEGDTIVFRRAVSVRIVADGAERQVITNAPDVGYLLDSMGIILGKRDILQPGTERRLSAGLTITVIRVRIKEVTERRGIPYGTDLRYTDDLVRGERRVVRAGQEGVEEFRYRVRLEDGREVARRLLARRVIEPPVSRIELVGTRPPNTQTGVASWYHRSGMVAAHRTLPFGTSVRVTNVANGKTVTVVIDDRGPYADGRIIDLSDDAFAQLAPLGAGTINVRIVW